MTTPYCLKINRFRFISPPCLAKAACTVLILFSQAALADTSCTIDSVSAVNFGTYDVFSPQSNNNGVGSLTISCRGGNSAIIVELSSGQSNTFVSRAMRSGRNLLGYNLYTSAARNVVWGDGTGGSSTMGINKNRTTTLSVFGQIPAGQDVAVGTYADNITTVVNF